MALLRFALPGLRNLRALAVGRRVAAERSLGQHDRELLLRHARPVPHAAGIHVYEGSARGGVEADTAALGAQACRAQLLERNARNVEIDRLAEHVLAELGHAARAPAQRRVGRRRTVSTNDPDRFLGADLAMTLTEQIEPTGVHISRCCI